MYGRYGFGNQSIERKGPFFSGPALILMLKKKK